MLVTPTVVVLAVALSQPSPRLQLTLLGWFVVELFMDRTQVRVGDVGVDLGGGNVAVAEHGLDRTEIGTVH